MNTFRPTCLLGIFLAGVLATGCAPRAENTPVARSIEAPTIIPSADWGSQPLWFHEDHVDAIDSYTHEPKRILIHHSGVVWREGTNPYNRMRNLQTWGMRERGWLDVPYHYLIAPNGQIFEGRALQFRPDTNTNFDTSGFVNIELMGSFGEQRPSEEQLRAAVDLSIFLSAAYEMDPDEIQGHKDVAQTGCPGEDLYRYLGQDGPFITWVKQGLAGEEPRVEALPPLEGGPHEFVPDMQVLWSGLD